MNILYLIGNGFDLAQGLKTSYNDFYNYLKTQTPINSVASLMLDHIKGPEVELWKDMEYKLGEFTKEISDKSLFEEFYYDLCDKLRQYLVEQTDSFSPKEGIQEKYIRDLVSPYEYLNEREKIGYRHFFNPFPEDRIVNIVSFNYTDVLDRAIDVYNDKLVLPSSVYSYHLQPVINIHGRLNNPDLLMGVNDETQINNPDFANDENIWDFLVKPRSNYGLGTMVDSRVEQLIAASNLIVTMGLSFGETDSYWWQRVGSRLKVGGAIKIILFEYVKDLPYEERKRPRICREKCKEFLSKCGIKESDYDKYSDKIYVCLNKGLFNPNTFIFNDDRKGI